MNPEVTAGQPSPKHGTARRSVPRGLGAGALATGAGGAMAACTAGTEGMQASATSTITLGYISPFTGSLAGYLSNCPPPPDFDVFWKQAHQQGWRPKLATVDQTFTTGVSDPHNKQEVASALHRVNYSGMCGPLNFASGPAPGVAIIAPVGVQWKASTGKYLFEMKVADNSLNKAVKIGANLEPTNA